MPDETRRVPIIESQAPIPEDLDAWLDLADRDLANSNTPIHNRPLLSIARLVEWEAIMDENGIPYTR
jgi:hypothetical protein